VPPPRSDTPLPPFPPGLTWVGAEPAAAERLTAKGPLLVHFFEAGELSGIQSLPHVDAWAAAYASAGLSTIGVHTPRSDLARAPEDFVAAIERLDLGFPVVSDSDYAIWHAYGCKGWPSLFLWGLGGQLRWYHIGIGGLAASEDAIREQLRAGDPTRTLPPRVHPAEEAGAEMLKPSDEVFPRGSHDRAWRPEPGEPLEVEYAGAGASAALDGSGSVRIEVDGEAGPEIKIEAPGLYELSSHREHGLHGVRIEFDGPIRVWSISFAAGTRERE
jgi:hypothetical protein